MNDTCQNCGGRGFYVDCFDDMCQGSEECFHGDGYAVCRECNGTGYVDDAPEEDEEDAEAALGLPAVEGKL